MEFLQIYFAGNDDGINFETKKYMMETIVSAIAALVAGYVIAFLVARKRTQAAETDTAVLRSRLDAALKQSEDIRADCAARIESVREEDERHLQQMLQEKDKACSDALKAKDIACNDKFADQERRHNEAMTGLQKRFDEIMQKVTSQVRIATDDMLKQRQKEFSESSSANLGQIVNPLKETMDRMKKAMDESAANQTKMSTEMKVAAENMMKQSEAARRSADDLARAFRHGTKVQGDWGETVLSELLELQGLTPNIHYSVQESIRDASGSVVKSEEGSSLRPDIILHLDARREVIIDSKVSLSAFMDYVNSETEDERQRHLRDHVLSLEKHVKELSAKDYSSYIKPPKEKIEYVIMFVPHSGALWTALNSKPDLWRRAMEKNVFIADEQTLFAALKIISMTWTHIAQAENHEKVYALAEEMLDRVGQFVKRFEAVGKSLDAARKAYDDAGAKLSPSGQSIIQTCGKLQRLGARQSTRNPIPQLADADEVPALSSAGTGTH